MNTANELRSKHPEGSKILVFTRAPGPPVQFNDKQLIESIEGLPAAGAPGPDGLRPSHLKQLCGQSAGTSRESFISALRNFTNVCLSGNIPADIRPFFFGASLCALRTKRRSEFAPHRDRHCLAAAHITSLLSHITQSNCGAILSSPIGRRNSWRSRCSSPRH